MDAKWWWLIGMIGPFGVMAFARVAGDAYNNWRSAREPHLDIASTEQAEALAPILIDLMPKVLGCEAGDCIITDQSSLSDFANGEEDLERFRENLRSCYGFDAVT